MATVTDSLFTIPAIEAKAPDASTLQKYLADDSTRDFFLLRLAHYPSWAWLPVSPETKQPTVAKYTEIEEIGQGRGRPKLKIKRYIDCRSAVTPRDNIALMTGKRNNVTVFDIDIKDDGFVFWKRFAVDHSEEIKDWYWVRTGSGGIHIYFDYVEELRTIAKGLTYEGKKIGLDVRNDGGYVVAAGSMHANGRVYKENVSMEEYLSKHDGKFPKMPLWVQRLCAADAEIVKYDENSYDVVLPTDVKAESVDRWTDVTIERMHELITYLPKDAAYSTADWHRGCRALTRIADDYKLSGMDKVCEEFIKLANRSGEPSTYDAVGGMRPFGGKLKPRDPCLTYLVKLARTEQGKLGKSVEFAEFEANIRKPLKDAHFDLIRLTCSRSDCSVEEVEDLMLETIFAIQRGAHKEWIVLLENGLTDRSQHMPFTKRGNNHTLLGKDVPFVGKAPATAAWVLERLVDTPRFTRNIYHHTDCVPSFLQEKPIIPPSKEGRTMNIFRGFATTIAAEGKSALAVIAPTLEATARAAREQKHESKQEEEIDGLTRADARMLAALKSKRPVQVLLEHLFTELCSGDIKGYTYVIKWLAYMVQHPEQKPASALVFSSGQGAGKNWFWDFIARYVVGMTYSAYQNNIDRATGHFNALLAHKLLTVLNESSTFAGSHSSADRLKSMLSDMMVALEKKGIDAVMASCFAHYVILTNHEMPVRIEVDDRRYCVLMGRKSGEQMPPSYYTYLYGLVGRPGSPTEEGVQMAQDLVNYLGNIDITGWAPQNIPETEGRTNIKIQCLSPMMRFMHAFLSGKTPVEFSIGREVTVKGADGKETKVKPRGLNIATRDLFDQYMFWYGRGRQEEFHQFMKTLKDNLDMKALPLKKKDSEEKMVGYSGYRVRVDELQQAFRRYIKSDDLVFEEPEEEFVADEFDEQ